MLRLMVFGLLLEVGLATAQTKLEDGGSCAAFGACGPKDSLNIADLRVMRKDLRVRVSPKGPELHLRLDPDTGTANNGSEDSLRRVGWIRVFSCETEALIQSLKVKSHCGPECFLRWFEVDDANFDGYLDIAVLRDRGALWGRQTWWVYSPTSGRFISNDFTQALSTISSNGLELDAAGHNIIVSILLGPGRCSRAQNMYHVAHGNRLVLMHEEKLTPTWNSEHTQSVGCTLTTLERVNGKMQVSNVQHYDGREN